MQTKKSFLEIFSRALSTFRDSFWGIFLTYCFTVPIAFILLYILTNVFHIPLTQKQIPQSFNLSPIMMVFAFIILILLAYGGILLQTWQTLVIKNNIFTSANNLLDAFKKAILKSLKVCLVIIVLLPIFTFLQFIVIKAFPSYINFLPLLYIPFIPLVVLFFGIVLQDGKFINVLINSLGVCITHYFRILGYTILLLVMYVLLVILMAVVLVFLKFLMPLFLFFIFILAIVFYISIYPFFCCFFTELYFDLATIDDEKPIEDLTKLSESYPDVIDINIPQESQNQEGAPQQEQQVQKEETPEGLKPLGGNYEDKK